MYRNDGGFKLNQASQHIVSQVLKYGVLILINFRTTPVYVSQGFLSNDEGTEQLQLCILGWVPVIDFFQSIQNNKGGI